MTIHVDNLHDTCQPWHVHLLNRANHVDCYRYPSYHSSMNPHSLPHDISLTDPSREVPDMGETNSLCGPSNGEPDQHNHSPSFTWTTPIEAVGVAEHTTPATIETPEVNGALQETVPERLGPDETAPLPHDDHLQNLYDAYHASYAGPINETATQMQQAKQVVLALLQRHYPESEDYIVEPTALGPYSAKGINFMLKEPKEPDSDTDMPPPRTPRHVARMTHEHYSYSAPWHYIPPEKMAAFVVKHRASEVNDGLDVVTNRTHMCLVIVLDDLLTLPRWSRANINYRGDVLSDVLGPIGGVAKGHGILLFGPRLELYIYDANNDKTPVTPCKGLQWKLDMRTTSLATVDEVLRGFAQREVVHRDDI